MPVVTTVIADATGIGEVSRQASTSGIGRNVTTLITLSDPSIVDQVENNGVPVHQIKGDGRKWFPILAESPESPVDGDMWLEQDVSLGTVLRIQTPAGILTISASGVSGGGLSYTAASALLQGYAVYLDPTNGPVYAVATVDGSHKYRPCGVVLADATMGNPVTIVTDGEQMAMADWTSVIGATNLVMGSRYYLTGTPGRYSTTPGSGVTSRVGYAANATTLIVQTGLNVVGTA